MPAVAVVALLLAELVRRLGGPRARRLLRLAFAIALGQVLLGLVLAPDAEKPFEGGAGPAEAGAAGGEAAGATGRRRSWRRQVLRHPLRRCENTGSP